MNVHTYVHLYMHIHTHTYSTPNDPGPLYRILENTVFLSITLTLIYLLEKGQHQHSDMKLTKALASLSNQELEDVSTGSPST